jgi:hypothetical protein
MRHLPYLLFRGHTYLPNEQAYGEEPPLSSFWAAFQSDFLAGIELPVERCRKVVVIDGEGSSASGGVGRLVGQ